MTSTFKARIVAVTKERFKMSVATRIISYPDLLVSSMFTVLELLFDLSHSFL